MEVVNITCELGSSVILEKVFLNNIQYQLKLFLFYLQSICINSSCEMILELMVAVVNVYH